MIAEKVFGFIGNWWITLIAVAVVITLIPQIKSSLGWQKVGRLALTLLFSIIALGSFSLRIAQIKEAEKVRLVEEYKNSWQNLKVKTNQESSRIVILDASGHEIDHASGQEQTFSLHPGHYIVKAGYLEYANFGLDSNSDIQTVEVNVPEQSSVNISLQPETSTPFTLSEGASGGSVYGGYTRHRRHRH